MSTEKKRQATASIIVDLCDNLKIEETKQWFAAEIGLLEVEHEEKKDKSRLSYLAWLYNKGAEVENICQSSVAYALGIAKDCPINTANSRQGESPDIDCDFSAKRRGELIQYIQEKYGEPNVSHIITFQNLRSRQVIRDLCRVYGIDLGTADRIAKSIPVKFGKPMGLEKAFSEIDALKAMLNDHRIETVYYEGLKMENNPKAKSIHAAGIIIAPQEVWKYIPVGWDRKNKIMISAFDGPTCERLSLMKMDILGLRTLDIYEAAKTDIKAIYGITIVDDDIPFDDARTWELFRQGLTRGVFQMEAVGFQEFSRNMEPDNKNDVIAMVALYRPGPLGSNMHTAYRNRKNGNEEVTYYPECERYLNETYGLMIYQEQVMQLTQQLCGFSLAEADILRKAIGKKKEELLRKQENKWKEGAHTVGLISEAEANKLWGEILAFSAYGFNKSIAADTLVPTLRGLVAIEQLKPYSDKVLTIEPNGSVIPVDVVALYDHSILERFEVEFDGGGKVTCTINHKFQTRQGMQPLYRIISEGLEVLHANTQNRWMDDSIYLRQNKTERQDPQRGSQTTQRMSDKDRYKRIPCQRTHQKSSQSIQIHGTDKQSNSRNTLYRRVVSIRWVGKGHTYDIEVDHPSHSFLLANGALTSNSHAAAYGIFAYRTAYIKANFPLYYLKAMLNDRTDDNARTAQYVHEVKEMGYQVIPPDINVSNEEFEVDGNSIIFGFNAIRGLGESVSKLIVKARRLHGNFTCLQDFCNKVSLSKVNRSAIMKLIQAGAFRSLYDSKSQPLAIIEKPKAGEPARWMIVRRGKKKPDAIKVGNNYKKIRREAGFTDLLAETEDPEVEFRKISEKDELELEYEALGFFLTSSPLKYQKDMLDLYFKMRKIRHVSEVEEVAETQIYGIFVGVIQDLKGKISKNRSQYWLFTLVEDVVVSAIAFESSKDQIDNIGNGDIVIVECKAEIREEGDNRSLQLIVYEIHKIVEEDDVVKAIDHFRVWRQNHNRKPQPQGRRYRAYDARRSNAKRI